MTPMMTMEVIGERLVTVERASEGAYKTIPIVIAVMRIVTMVANFRKVTLLYRSSRYYE